MGRRPFLEVYLTHSLTDILTYLLKLNSTQRISGLLPQEIR
jgi:hypothetical protein